VSSYRAPSCESVDTKQRLAVHRDNISGTRSVVDCPTSEMHLAVMTHYDDILPYRNMSATHSHSDRLQIVKSADVYGFKKFTSTNHKDEREMKDVCDTVCERRVCTILMG
jgi:hypothetical protein